jgi:hypothetical protein
LCILGPLWLRAYECSVAGSQVGGGHVCEERALAGSGAAEERHVFPARIGRHDELGPAKEIICVGSDGGGVEHGTDFTGEAKGEQGDSHLVAAGEIR